MRLMLDVHKESVTACVRVPHEGEGLHQEIREFAATTRGLLLLRDWLASFEVRLVGMEATGVYWKPVYYLLEDDFECWLLNARHLKNVPGRKTDVKDAEWICQLVEHGLVRPSFVPPKEIRELRNLTTRYRKRQVHKSAPRRSSVWRRSCRRPGSSSPRWQRGCFRSFGASDDRGAP